MIKGIIFDCFGVLVTYGFNTTFIGLGGDIDTDKQFLQDTFASYNSGQISDNEFLSVLGNHLGVDAETVSTSLAKDEHLDQMLLSYIKELKNSYKIGLLSNIGRGGFERYFAGLDSHEYFDDLVLSGEEGLVKPDPRIYELAAKRLSLEVGECVFVDDSERNCIAAENVGMKSIIYTGFAKFKTDLDQILSSS